MSLGTYTVQADGMSKTVYRRLGQAPATGAPDSEWDEYYAECEAIHDRNRDARWE